MQLDTQNTHQSLRVPITAFLTPRAVRAAWGISIKTVHKLVSERKLTCVQVTARDLWRIHEDCAGYPRYFQEPGRGNGESAEAGGSNSIWEAPGCE